MLYIQLITLCLWLSIQIVGAETVQPSPSPMPGECTHVEQVTLYRCVCRLNVATSGGRTSISIPLYTDGSSTIFSATDLNGQRCEGTLPPDRCRPGLSGRAQGTYACAQGTTTESGGFEIRW